MNLSKQTVDILKNFSTINASIAVDVGNTLQTMSAMKNILVKSTVEETFNTEFAIYDLSEFLNLSTSETFIGANLVSIMIMLILVRIGLHRVIIMQIVVL